MCTHLSWLRSFLLKLETEKLTKLACLPSVLQSKDTNQLVTSELQMTWLSTAFHTSTWIPAEKRHHKPIGRFRWSINNNQQGVCKWSERNCTSNTPISTSLSSYNWKPILNERLSIQLTKPDRVKIITTVLFLIQKFTSSLDMLDSFLLFQDS